jgi:type I restriction enzyme S subunit
LERPEGDTQSTHLQREFDRSSIDRSFLRYAINQTLDEQIAKAHGGVGLRHVTKGMFEDTTIALPPLPEQRRIVAKIDSLSSKSKRAREQLDRVPRLVEKYKQAVLTVAFQNGFGLRNVSNNSFGLRPLSDAARSTFYGPRIAKEAYVSSGVPTLRTTDIADWGKLSLQGPPQVMVTDDERRKWGFQDGDLMVTRTGTIGKCAVYELKYGPALPSAYLIRVRLNLQIADPHFVVFFLLSPHGQQQLLDGRTAVAQPNINANAILSVELPLPPTELQRAIVRRIEHLFDWIDRLAAEAISARKLIDRLDQAILAKAFRGELVPQDPTDEPPSLLLDRIRVQQNTSEGTV